MTRGLAHEIKNPLSTVGLNAQLLREEILDSSLADSDRDRMVRRVDALAREATRLSDVLNDFLRYAGRLQLDARPTDLRSTVQELADFFAPQAEQARVLLRLELPDAPVVAHVDGSLLKQVLLNLMLNAVQAMQRNGPSEPRTLTISVSGSDARSRREVRTRGESRSRGEPPTVELCVHDSGPGVPAEIRAEIFQPYVTTRPGGNGLGLATARRIVEAHGGRVEVRDGPTGGSIFAVTIPVDGSARSGTATPASPSA